jgi:MarR family transcriptional regulator, organic hydroperoxide resistance regulator
MLNMKELMSYQLVQISNFHRNSLEKYMAETGLHAGQVFILSSLWETDGQSQAEIVRRLQVTPPTVYHMVIRLQESGFVELRKCESDARLMRVFLTEKGVSVKSAVEEQWRKLEEFLFAEMTETEKIMFSMLLQKIRKK